MNIKIDNARVEITLIEHSLSPDFTLPGEMEGNLKYVVTDYKEAFTKAPAFTRICLTVHTSPNSDFQMEGWLPDDADWNHRMMTIGNSGSAMTVNHLALLGALMDGFASFHCNLSTRDDLDRGISNPEIWKDFGWRATHLTTEIGRQIVSQFYGRAEDYRYFYGCSTGGQQGISAAEKFPEDYHGIVAVAPAISRVHLHLYFVWNLQQLMYPDGTFVFSGEEVKKLIDITIGYFQSLEDGEPGDYFVTNPRLNAKQKEELWVQIIEAGFLTSDQLQRLEKVYEGPVHPQTSERLYCGFARGAEPGFFGLNSVKIPGYTYEYLYPVRWLCGQNFADFDIWACDVFAAAESDTAKAIAREVNTDSADVSAFKAVGGKLIMTGGSMDAVVPEANITNYYQRVMARHGGASKTQDFFRYFIVPGFSHSIKGGLGTDYIGHADGTIPESAGYIPVAYYDAGMVASIMDWVEKSIAPETITATGFLEMKYGGILVPDTEKGIRFQRIIKAYPGDGLTNPEPRAEKYWEYI